MSEQAELRDGVHVVELLPANAWDRTFLLLHGLGGTLRFWSGVAPALAATLAVQFLAGLVPLRPWSAGVIARSTILRTIALGFFVAEPRRLDPALTAEALSYTGGARTVLRALRQARGIDLPALLDGARVPVDLVRGDRDTMNTAADFAIVRQHADVRRELSIPDCRHWPLIEDPQALIDFVLGE